MDSYTSSVENVNIVADKWRHFMRQVFNVFVPLGNTHDGGQYSRTELQNHGQRIS